MTTTIQINDKTWEELNKRKKVGESFDQVINRMLMEFPEIKRLPKNQTKEQIKMEVNKK